MTDDPILSVRPLGFPWETEDPFLFCVHHDDAYPKGNDAFGPAVPLSGRQLGQDFVIKDGFRMYHGSVVPGFPPHPHRGFETVTLARRGFIDHADSLGATARFGQGDVQWMTAGAGIVHSEMFPLLSTERDNPVELFQIWLNLPAEDKLVEPHFSMFWNHQIPEHIAADPSGRRTIVRIVAGTLGDASGPPPPPKSWAARSDTDVAIWTISLEPHARFTVPPAQDGSRRTLYFFLGESVSVAGRKFEEHAAIRVAPGRALELVAGDEPTELLMLQGRPIAEPVAQYGPFVMNTRAQIQQAILDYQRTRFGGWPWPSEEPVHPREAGRFAQHADGRVERAEG